MKFREFINESISDYDVIRIPRETNEKTMFKLFDFLIKKGKILTDSKKNSILRYNEDYEVGIYIDNKNIEFDRWGKDIDDYFTHYRIKKYRIANIGDILSSDSKYVKQLKWN